MFGSKKSGIPEILRSQNGDTVVSPWCHHGGTKREKGTLPWTKPGPKKKGKEVKPEFLPGSHWTVPPRGARTDETKRFPGWGTWRSNPPTSNPTQWGLEAHIPLLLWEPSPQSNSKRLNYALTSHLSMSYTPLRHHFCALDASTQINCKLLF